jgi:hypothetical protein
VIKLLKLKVLIVIIPVICFICSEFVIKPRAVVEPSMPYNVDSALYYIIFFALGYLAYPYLLKLFQLDTKKKRTVFITVYIIALLYSAGVFLGFDILAAPYIVNKNILIFTAVVRAAVISLSVMMTAKLMSGLPYIARMGTKTLYLCGNEWIIKALIPSVAMMFGLTINLINPLCTLLYTIGLIVANAFILIPVEERLIKAVKENLFGKE